MRPAQTRSTWRRGLAVGVTFLAFASGTVSSTPGSQAAQVERDPIVEGLRDERRGLVFDGLRRRMGGPCGDAFEVVERVSGGRVRCSHGPDPAPDGVDVRARREFGASDVQSPQGAVAAAQ